MIYKPPFKITNNIIKLAQDISKELGFLIGTKLKYQTPHLRKNIKVQTIQSSLAIEGNSLTVDKITTILNGRRVLALQKDIIEVKNAIKVYKNLKIYNPLLIDDLLKAHKIIMQSLISDNGQWRSRAVGLVDGNKVTHIAPKAERVPYLMENLFEFLQNKKEISWLIKACIFHYELEFIHPFSDGNGRMGRLWQQLILMQEDDIFEYLPIETLIKNNQSQYYKVLGQCDENGNSTLFIEFMLEQILSIILLYTKNNVSKINTPESRLLFSKNYFKQKKFSRKEYVLLHKDISTATASRDLKYGLLKGELTKYGENNQTRYRFNIKL